MPTLNIKDPEVHRMAHELARRRRTTATGAVRDLLREALSENGPHDEVSARERFEAIMEIARRAGAVDAPILTDEDLYDENGLPR